MASAKRKTLKFELDDEDLKLFTEEADEQIALLDTILVQLESDPDPELIQQIFRAAHTLKGSSATIGHTRMAQLTHAMESVLDQVRQGRREPSSHMVDALLAGVDALRVLANEVVTRVDSGLDIGPLENALRGILESGGEPVASTPGETKPPEQAALPAEAIPAVRAALEGGSSIVFVEVEVEPECQLPSIRCYQALQELNALGTVLLCWPERAVIEAGGGEYRVAALLKGPRTAEHIRASLETISDIKRPGVRPLTSDDLFAPGERPPASATAPEQIRERAEAASPVSIESARQGQVRQASQSIRIDVERLDGLMNLVGELVIDRTRLQKIREQLSVVLKHASLTELMENFEETTSHLARVTDELQEEIMRSRMLPVRSVLSRLPRLVRDVANKCGKKVELITAGEETELDRSVIEEISDPLVHILRNAVDHGIETPEERRAAGKPETGTIRVTAWNQETSIYLSIKDDGKGLDTAALREKAVERGIVSREAAEAASDEMVMQYIFFAGLSTAKVLSDVSGRGVGMDIVRTNIERLNGSIRVRSKPGQGSEFVIQLPLTLATTKALMVVANDTAYAMPLVSVTEALSEQEANIQWVSGQKTLRLRGRLLPVADLARALGDARPRKLTGKRYVVAAHHGGREAAFVVDDLLGEQDVVVKTLGGFIGARRGLTGATILGDGTLGLIIDAASLVADQAGFAASA